MSEPNERTPPGGHSDIMVCLSCGLAWLARLGLKSCHACGGDLVRYGQDPKSRKIAYKLIEEDTDE